MTRGRLASFAAVLMLSVAGAGWAGQNETERVHNVVALRPGGTVELHNFSGNVRITGTDVSEVVIDAVRRAPRDRLNRVKLDVQSSGSTVTIEANKKVSSSWLDWSNNNVVETDLDIQMPRSANLEVNVFSSPVRIAGVGGSLRLESFSGNLEIDQAGGPVRAKTFSGEMQVWLAAGVERPDLDLSTFSGDIQVRVSASAKAQVDFDSFSGDLTSDLPLTLNSKSGHHLRARLNGSDTAAGAMSSLRLKTFSGDVRIKQ